MKKYTRTENNRADVRRLTDLLVRLEDHWRRVDAPIVRFLQPGASEEAMAAAGERVALQLPAEARAWFAWHDGIRFPEPQEQPAGDLTNGATGYQLLSLDGAVKKCISLRKLDKTLSEDIGMATGSKWAPWWFPLAVQSNGDVLAIDCKVAPDSTTPVRSWDTEVYGKVVAAPSLADVVETWVMMLDENLVFWDRERERWWQDVLRIQPWMWRRSAD